ncbi:man(5)GlcNAc(2)-PP-dolichol translocation protein RFT1-like isoform X1 [Styela clava]
MVYVLTALICLFKLLSCTLENYNICAILKIFSFFCQKIKMAKTNEDIKDVLSNTSRLASYNMVLQLSFRLLTFFLNAFTLRYITKDELGVVNVRLVLLYSTLLFLSREAFRRACLSQAPKRDDKHENYVLEWRKMMNLLWCIVPIGLFFTSLLTYIWMNHLSKPDPVLVPYYSTAALIFGISVVIELLAEPLFIFAQALMFVRLRVLSEGIPMILKCLTTVILIVLFPKMGILAFCVAQIIFSISYVFIIYGYFTWYISTENYKKFDDFPFTSMMQFFPTSTLPSSVDSDTASLIWSFFKQSALKQILTEGEKYVMTIFNVLTFGDQGVYDIVNNLGSMAARFIFLPIEESFYVFFAKMLERGVPLQAQNQEKVKLVRHVLFCVLRLVVLIGLVILVFGFSYSYIFLHLYGGSLLSEGSGPGLLRVYSFYVLLIAINGTTECFVFAAMSQKDVDKYNQKMLIFSLLFLTSSYYFTIYLGSVGFIFANCLNMIVRIIHSFYFIKRYFKGHKGLDPLTALTPHWFVVQTFVAAFTICWLSENICHGLSMIYYVIHIIIGAACLAGLLYVLYLAEEKVVEFLKEQYFSKKKKA